MTNYYIPYRASIMLGMSLAACFGMLYMPWTCMLGVIMMQREKLPVLAMMQICGGLLTAWILVMCPVIWAYCAEASTSIDPATIKTLHFIAWYIFNMTYMITTIQCVSVGIFAIMDKKLPQIIPVWVGWMSIVIGLSWTPLTFLPYFKTGIFAINGFWAFHFVVLGFGIFTLSLTTCMLKAIRQERSVPAYGVGAAFSRQD